MFDTGPFACVMERLGGVPTRRRFGLWSGHQDGEIGKYPDLAWVVVIGPWRHWHAKAIPLWPGARRMTAAMAAGSIIAAILGGLDVAYTPVVFLRALLGCVLLAAAGKTMMHRLGDHD